MPTYEAENHFKRQLNRLTPQERAAFDTAVAKFVHDLKSVGFRPGLRVKKYRRVPGWWEMTWADDGRALFRYGEPVKPGHVHVIWLRIGGHEIFDEE